MKKILNIASALLFIAVVGIALWFFIQSLREAAPGVAAAIIGAISVIAVGIWSHYSTRRREIHSRHFVEKKNAYMHLINLIHHTLRSEKEGNPISEEEMIGPMYDFKREIMIWGDQAVINALEIYESHDFQIIDETNPWASLLAMDDLLRAIRKDLGHDDSDLKRGSLAGLFIISDDRAKLHEDLKVPYNS